MSEGRSLRTATPTGGSGRGGLRPDQWSRMSRCRACLWWMMRAVERIQRVTAVIEKEGDGYVALCPELDIASQGGTIEETRANLQKALTLSWRPPLRRRWPSASTSRSTSPASTSRSGKLRRLSGREMCGSPPLLDDLVDDLSDGRPGIALIPAGHQVGVIGRMSMAHVRSDGEVDRIRVQTFRGSAPTHATAVLPACMLRDSAPLVRRATRVPPSDGPREILVEPTVEAFALRRRPRPRLGSRSRVSFALFLRPAKGLVLDEDALPLVPLASGAPPDDNGSKTGVLARPPGQRRVASRQEHQVVKISTVHTARLAVDQADEGA